MYHAIHLFKVYNSVASRTFRVVRPSPCSNSKTRSPEKETLDPLSSHSLVLSPQPPAPTNLLSVSTDLPLLDIVCKWTYNIWPLGSGFFHSAECLRFTHIVAWISQDFIPVHGQIIFHCVDAPHLLTHSSAVGHLSCCYLWAVFSVLP